MRLYWVTTGYEFKGVVIDRMLEFMSTALNSGIHVSYTRTEGSLIPHVREKSLGHDITTLDPTKEIYSHPFKGADYDYILITDSDIVFRYDDFKRLLDADKDVITGIYRMTNLKYCCVPYYTPYDKATFLEFDQLKKLRSENSGPIELWHGGLGFTLIKKGVLESVPLPWFSGSTVTIEEKERFAGEDVYFFQKIRLAGFKIWAHPEVLVGHLKYNLLS